MTHFWTFRLFEQVTGVGGVQVREATTILHGGHLLQQLVVDCWASAEQLNLRWLQTHQLPFDLSFIKALLMHSKMTISIHIRLVDVLYCHPASLALIAT